MKSMRSLQRLGVLLLLGGSAQAQSPEVVDIEHASSSARLRDGADEFVLDLTLEPLAGQTLQAGDFTVEFITAAPTDPAPSPSIFAHGFETPAGDPR